MAATVGRAIREGVSAAARSGAGMAAFAGGWLVLGALAIGLVAATRIPPELFQFQEPAVELSGPSAPAAAAGPRADAAALPTESSAQAHERDRLTTEWFGRAWPVLGLACMLLFAGSTAMQAGQLGYMVLQADGRHQTIADFAASARRIFGPLLGATLLSMGFAVGFILLAVLIGVLFSLESIPGLIRGILGVLLVVASLLAMVWVGVRMTFWFIILAADRTGPLHSLKTAFRVTRDRWWRIFGLNASVWGITLVVQLVFGALGGLLEAAGGLMGGPMALGMSLLGSGLALAVNLFIGFAVLGTYVRYYKNMNAAGPEGAS